MKVNDIRKMTTEEINKKVVDAKQELFNLRFSSSLGNLEKPSRIKELRHDVARCKTVLREREMEERV
ncbi:MAG: 50S ribosomal protein L29 [Bacilli bacterium]|nr:50S ribosomal protein L29 [Bacilli bacterium]